jgi:hypothetical protein
VLAVFTHAQAGAGQLTILLRSFLLGFYGFAAFCLTLAVALPDLQTGPSFALASLGALAVQATTLNALHRSPIARLWN